MTKNKAIYEDRAMSLAATSLQCKPNLPSPGKLLADGVGPAMERLRLFSQRSHLRHVTDNLDVMLSVYGVTLMIVEDPDSRMAFERLDLWPKKPPIKTDEDLLRLAFLAVYGSERAGRQQASKDVMSLQSDLAKRTRVSSVRRAIELAGGKEAYSRKQQENRRALAEARVEGGQILLKLHGEEVGGFSAEVKPKRRYMLQIYVGETSGPFIEAKLKNVKRTRAKIS